MKVALAFALMFVARFAVGAWVDPGRDGDIAWQLWLGRQILENGHIPLALGREAFTASGAPWVPQEWALSLLVALTVGTPHFFVLVALTAAAGGATLFLTAWGCRRLGSSTTATALCTVCVAFSMVESYGIRAQVFAWAALAAFMFVLRTCRGRARWLAIPLAVVWANLHASAMLAPVLLLLWSIGAALEERSCNMRVLRYAVLTLAATAAVFVTPLGYRLPIYAIELLRSPIRFSIQEWQPANLWAVSFAAGPLILIAATCAFGIRGKRRWSEFLIFAAVSWMAFSALRNVPVCAIVLAPAVARRLTDYLPKSMRLNVVLAERPVIATIYTATLAAGLFSAYALANTSAFTKPSIPTRPIALLASVPGTHRLYCEDFAWCSSALAYPSLREFIDGRCDPFPLPVWKDYERVAHAERGWPKVLERRGVDALVVNRAGKLSRLLARNRDWRLVYSDDKYRLFMRRTISVSGQRPSARYLPALTRSTKRAVSQN